MVKFAAMCSAVATLTLVATAALAGARTAHVSITGTSPFAVRGAGFRAHERVSVTVSAKTSLMKAVVAGPRGGFKVSFPGFSIGNCVPYAVRAKGSRGSTAFVKVVPECAAPTAQTTTDVGLPSDPGAPKKPH